MDDGLLCTREAFERRLDQILARLGQDLHQHVIRNASIIDQPANEIVFGRTGAGKADFDFLQADLQQQIEEALLLFGIHRIDQRLVAVAHIGRKPAGRLGNRAAWPLTIRQVDLGEGAVLDRGVFEHGHDLENSFAGAGLLPVMRDRCWAVR